MSYHIAGTRFKKEPKFVKIIKTIDRIPILRYSIGTVAGVALMAFIWVWGPSVFLRSMEILTRGGHAETIYQIAAVSAAVTLLIGFFISGKFRGGFFENLEMTFFIFVLVMFFVVFGTGSVRMFVSGVTAEEYFRVWFSNEFFDGLKKYLEVWLAYLIIAAAGGGWAWSARSCIQSGI